MQEIPQEQVTKRFQSLNATLQDAIFSPATTDAVLKICALRDVPENDIARIGQLAGRVLLGYLRPENFATEIQKEAGIDGMKAAQVAHDIDAEIFSSVRLELKKLYPPTIQTPTVATQGFVARAPEPPTAAARRAPEPARPYVVPIPEKFRSRSAWPAQQPATEAPTPIAPVPAPTEEIKTPAPAKPSVIPDSKFKIQKDQETQQKTELPKPQTSAEQQEPPIKPIVPLPTFIQSKFKETLKQTTGEKQVTQENPALKSAITHFTTPHTAAKPAEEQPKESIYRETVPEEQKPSGGMPTGGTQQKAEGKVVDLSGL